MSAKASWLSRVATRVSALAQWLGARKFLVACIFLAGFLGLGAGYVIAKSSLVGIARQTAASIYRDWFNPPQEAAWGPYDTHLGDFEFVRHVLFAGDDTPMAALEEVDGHLLFLTQRGALYALTPANTLESLNLTLPMRTAELEAAAVPRLDMNYFRALDLLAIQRGPHAYDLYASFDRYNPRDRCFEIAVSRTRLDTTPEHVGAGANWEDVFVTQPCVPPRTGESAFIGIQSGGRLARFSEHIMLLSVGDLEFDGAPYPGVTELINGPQDLAWDLGKIIAIDLESGRAERWAAGFRNPQGLLVDAQGRIWETEHGPLGGDEVNLVERGRDYGWPSVTYGMRYMPQGQNWPLNPTYGGHEGFERPAYVFVPSIGISQLIQPSAQEFPFWDTVLLATSLRGRSLYVLRLDGSRIIYAEPLSLGERLRDIINRANGEIAIITDLGALIRMRAPTQADDHAPVVVTDVRRRSAAAARPDPIGDGQRLFAANCQSCHSLTGGAGVGPSLAGVVGRDIAGTDYSYSPALRRTRGAWTEARLIDFLEHPENFDGTTMPQAGLTHDQTLRIVAYLKTTAH